MGRVATQTDNSHSQAMLAGTGAGVTNDHVTRNLPRVA